MKIFLFLFCVVAAGILGYSFEPQMRYELTGKVPEQKLDPVRTVVVNIGKPKKEINPSTWPADKLPKKVELKRDAEIANETGDMKMTVMAGNANTGLTVSGTAISSSRTIRLSTTTARSLPRLLSR